MPPDREANILETLNRDVQLYMEGGKSLYDAYSLMVDMNPYRVLADASYDWEEEPLSGSKNYVRKKKKNELREILNYFFFQCQSETGSETSGSKNNDWVGIAPIKMNFKRRSNSLTPTAAVTTTATTTTTTTTTTQLTTAVSNPVFLSAPEVKKEKISSNFVTSPVVPTAQDSIRVYTPAATTSTPAAATSTPAATFVKTTFFSSPASIHLTPAQSNRDAFSEYGHVEGHQDFVQMLINAKAYADINQICAPVCWRGYNTLVEPNLGPFTKDIIKERLENAIEFMKNGHKGNQVFY